MKKIFIYAFLLCGLLTFSTLESHASYNYGPGDIVPSSESIHVSRVVDSSNLADTTGVSVDKSVYQFGSLYDVATDDEHIYIADGTSNVILVLNNQFQMVTKFPSAESEIKLNGPRGLYVTKDAIYVCDYGNKRILIFDKSYNVIQTVTTPEDPAFAEYEFKPKKIAVNRTGRMYVIAEGINEGIIDFNPDGTFSRYYGMNAATVSGWQAFWLLFTSEEQREQQGYNFGASLANLCIDQDEYIYTVSSPSAGKEVIKKLNYKGSDVLVRNGYGEVCGDVVVYDGEEKVPTGASNFVDIDCNEYGSYIALDKTRGRIFTYDFEGNLLYIGGSLATAIGGTNSNIKGEFQIPEALTYYQDKILVVDSKNQNLIVFEYTEFGQLINSATKEYYNNEYEKAAEIWKEVKALDTNYYLAYSGIGKAQLREGDYKNAMTNLKLGYDKYNYSRAYQKYRYEKMVKVVPYVIGLGLALCVYLFGRSIYKNIKRDDKEKEGM